MDFTEILKDIMAELELNQTKLAEKLGIKHSQISEWLSGKCLPGYYNLQKICQALDISGDRILGLEKE